MVSHCKLTINQRIFKENVSAYTDLQIFLNKSLVKCSWHRTLLGWIFQFGAAKQTLPTSTHIPIHTHVFRKFSIFCGEFRNGPVFWESSAVPSLPLLGFLSNLNGAFFSLFLLWGLRGGDPDPNIWKLHFAGSDWNIRVFFGIRPIKIKTEWQEKGIPLKKGSAGPPNLEKTLHICRFYISNKQI